MADPITLTINGRDIQAAPGTLLIEVARANGIEIPAFCYYEGFSLQAACRMCLVEIEKMPKLMPACTMPVAAGMVVQTETAKVIDARRGMLEFLLTNHPLDCPVCDKGGECELQDMVFRYGNGESRFTDIKHHVDEKQWSPAVYYDAARCILCYRCVRVCDEGLGVTALGLTYRGVDAEITPSHGDHLECDECGWCIDACPVGALTSGSYRYQARPWELNYAATVCTHCADGCKTTLSVRNGEILRANNRDRSGVNGEFLCAKGRFGYDFITSPERLQTPLIRKNGQLEPASWREALALVGAKFKAVRQAGGRFGVVGSTRTTNEENYYLQKFARQHLATESIDHRQSGDIGALLTALGGRSNALASVGDLYTTKAALVIGADLSQQHPLLAVQLRANHRHHRSATYVVTPGPVREDSYAARSLRAEPGAELAALESLGDTLKQHASLLIVFGDSIKGDAVAKLVAFGDSLGIEVKYLCLVDDANSRGAWDMRLTPGAGGLALHEMLTAPELDVLWVVGADPLDGAKLASEKAFVVVEDMFLTRTAQRADVVLPSASAYEKSGTFTNGSGEVQRLKVGPKVMGAKSDLEIMSLIAREMGVDSGVSTPDAVFSEIRQSVAGYNVPLAVVATGGAAQATTAARAATPAAQIGSAGHTLFTSGTLGRHSKMLKSLLEAPGELYKRSEK